MRSTAALERATVGDAAHVRVAGLIDEHFAGLGNLDGVRVVVVDVAGISRMTSFGVRQWLKAMAAVPHSVGELYFAGCPPIFVDQLNMIRGFGGSGRVVSVKAPYACPRCHAEYEDLIDVVAEGPNLAQGILPTKNCQKCGGPLEFDEIPESYFACLNKYGAADIDPVAAQLLASPPSAGRARRPPPPVPQQAAPPPPTSTETREKALQLVGSRADLAPSRRSMSPAGWIAIAAIAAVIAAGVYFLVKPS